MRALEPSRYNVVVRLRAGGALVHNTLTSASAVLDANELCHLQDVPMDATSARLADAGFLVPKGSDERAVAKREYVRQRFDPRKVIMTVAPTLACNFGCDYCFQGADKPTTKMSREVQDALVHFVRLHESRMQRIHVAWYGGEPLLALDVIKRLSDRIIERCKQKRIGYDAMIVTNGFKLNAETARTLTERAVHTAQVTLDGPSDYHDTRRATLKGRGTFERIIDNLEDTVTGSRLRISVRINIDSRNAPSIEDLLEKLARRGFSRKRGLDVYFAPVEAITEGCHSVSEACMTKKEYAALETRLYHRAYALGLSSLPYPRQFRSLCTAVRPGGYVITPTGDVHKCWDTVSMPQFRVGTIFEPSELARDRSLKEWLAWDPFEAPACSECKLLPSCSGSCAHKFVNRAQTRGEAGVLPCPPWKYQLRERIVALAVDSGAIRMEDVEPADLVTDPVEICPAADPNVSEVLAVEAPDHLVPLDRLMSKRIAARSEAAPPAGRPEVAP